MIMACGGRHRAGPDRQLGNRTAQEGSHIATDDGTSSAHGDSAYSGLPNKLVRAANGIDHAYRDTGPGASGSAPLVLLQHFRGNLDNWGPALIDATRTRRTGSCSSTTRNSRPMSRPSSLTGIRKEK
jgi:hypothetical protein